MALNGTTRQANKRAIGALADATLGVKLAEIELVKACAPLEDLGRYTNAHDALVEDLHGLLSRVREVRANAFARLRAEAEGE